MDIQSIKGRLAFLQEAERLKSVLRSAHTSTGRAESTAEHTWRLCLMAMAFESELSGLDMLKILKMCIVHDRVKPFTATSRPSRKASIQTKVRRKWRTFCTSRAHWVG